MYAFKGVFCFTKVTSQTGLSVIVKVAKIKSACSSAVLKEINSGPLHDRVGSVEEGG